MVDQRLQPPAGVLQGPLQPWSRNHLEVPGTATRVHGGYHGVPHLAELTQGVDGGLGHRRRVAPLSPQGAPPFERLRSSGLHLHHHFFPVGGSLFLLFEEEHLHRGIPGSFSVHWQRQPHRAVGVARHQQLGTHFHRDRLGVPGIGGVHAPSGPFHGPRHHRLKGVARLHGHEGFFSGGIGGDVSRCGVPEGAAAVQAAEARTSRACPVPDAGLPSSSNRAAGRENVFALSMVVAVVISISPPVRFCPVDEERDCPQLRQSRSHT